MSRRAAVTVLAGLLLVGAGTAASAQQQATPSAGVGTVAAPPPLPVSVQRRPDGSVCVTISLQVPQCVGPIS